MFYPAHTMLNQPYKLPDKHSRGSRRGISKRGNLKGGAAPFLGPRFVPCRRHAPQRLSPQKTNHIRTDYPHNNTSIPIAARREYMYARQSEWNER